MGSVWDAWGSSSGGSSSVGSVWGSWGSPSSQRHYSYGGGGGGGTISVLGVDVPVSPQQRLAFEEHNHDDGWLSLIKHAPSRLLHDTLDFAQAAPVGLYHTGRAVTHDVNEVLGGGLIWDALHGRAHSETFDKVVKPTADQYRYQYGPLFEGHPGEFGKRFLEHPLGPLLDVATLATGGAAGAARAGRAGMLGEWGARYGKFTSEPRVIRDVPAITDKEMISRLSDVGTSEANRIASSIAQGHVIPKGVLDRAYELIGAGDKVELLRSRTPVGQAGQVLRDVVGERVNPEGRLGYLSNEARVARIKKRELEREGRSRMIGRVNEYQNATNTLTKDEQFGYHLAHERRDPAEAFLRVYESYRQGERSRQLRRYLSRLAGKPWAEIQRIMEEPGRTDPERVGLVMSDSKVAAVVRSPRDEFVAAVRMGKSLEAESGKTLEELGSLTPEARFARRFLGSRLDTGARFDEGHLHEVDQHDPLAEKLAGIEQSHRQLSQGLKDADKRMAAVNARAERLSELRARAERAPEPPQAAELRAAREARDQAEAELTTAKERYYGKDAAVENAPEFVSTRRLSPARGEAFDTRSRTAEREAKQANDEVRRLERQVARRKAAAEKVIDRMAAAEERYAREALWTNPRTGEVHMRGGKAAEAAHNYLELVRRDAAARTEELASLRQKLSRATEARDAAERTRDEAKRAYDVLVARERAMRQADARARRAEAEYGKVARRHERQTKRVERLSEKERKAQERAAETAGLQRDLQRRIDDALEFKRGMEEEMLWARHGQGPSLVSSTRRYPTTGKPEFIGEDKMMPTSYTAGQQFARDVIEGREVPVARGFHGGATIEELELRDWLQDVGLEDAPVSPRFGERARFPHVGSAKRPSPLSASAPVRAPKMLGETKRNRGVRAMAARFLTHPSVVSRDYLRTMSYQMILDYREYLKRFAVELPADGHPPEGYRYFFTGKADSIPRAVRESEELAREQLRLDRPMTEKEVQAAGHRIVWDTDHADLYRKVLAKDAERNMRDQLHEAGVRMIPERYAKAFERETAATDNLMVKVYDRALDVWRAIVLRYRPAWLVYNIVGNHLLYALQHGGVAGAKAYAMALQGEKVPGETWVKLWRFSISKRKYRYAKLIDEISPGAMFASFNREAEPGRPAFYMGDTRMGNYIDAMYDEPWTITNATVKAPLKVLHASTSLVRAWGEKANALNLSIGDDLVRRAVWIKEAERDAYVKGVKAKLEQSGETNVTLGRTLEAIAKGDVKEARRLGRRLQQHMDQTIGNFTDMGHFERTYLRRFLPFYSWFKVITKLLGKLLVENPVRSNVLLRQEQAAGRDDFDLTHWGGGPVPSYLASAIPYGDRAKGMLNVITMQGINPLATPAQLWSALTNPGQTGSDQLVSISSPVISASIAALAKKDPFYGGDYHGPGSTVTGAKGDVARFFGYFSGGLPQPRLLQQLGLSVEGGKHGYTGPGAEQFDTAFGLANKDSHGKITAGYESKLYDSHAALWGVPDYLWSFFGLPARRYRIDEAASRARAEAKAAQGGSK